jgi:hypothetical protein
MKRCLVLILCLTSLPLAFAQQPNDPATKEDVQQLLELQSSRKSIDLAMEAVKQQLPALIKGARSKDLPNATPEDLARLNAFTSDLLDKTLRTMPYDELMQAMVPAYQHHYTHAEIQGLIQFYSSPLGKKMIAEMPGIVAESMQATMPIIQKWQKSQMAELQKSTEAFARQLKEHKSSPATPAQPAKPIPASLMEPMQR